MSLLFIKGKGDAEMEKKSMRDIYLASIESFEEEKSDRDSTP